VGFRQKKLITVLKPRIKSFAYAFAGVAAAFKTQTNVKIHFLAALVVVAASCYFEIDKVEWLFVLSAVFLVLVSELFNTAIEALCDLYSSAYHPKIKFIKDVAAGAVLLSAFYALTIAGIVFIPKIFM
jgi:diacylglycerol kinase (ATP)